MQAYVFPKQFSSDEVVTTKEGRTVTMKTYVDNGKIRTETSMNGMVMTSIVRTDQQKMYSVLASQKMVMVLPLDPEKIKQMLPPGSGGDAQVEKVGSEPVDSIATDKYKITNSDGKVLFLWVDAARQCPVKMASQDGAFTMTWKNFQTGPQDAALFEPPADYRMINMPQPAVAPPPGGGG
ncbi:MAG TPA: DUF4412 domain-containing protein [Candidatus Methylacidiphilales bacterium]|nr:DUF4412 domain-containing protein [Candidatus Methylacidiphilales bacterium]